MQFSLLVQRSWQIRQKCKIASFFKFFSHKLTPQRNTRRINAHSFRNGVNEAVKSKRPHD